MNPLPPPPSSVTAKPFGVLPPAAAGRGRRRRISRRAGTDRRRWRPLPPPRAGRRGASTSGRGVFTPLPALPGGMEGTPRLVDTGLTARTATRRASENGGRERRWDGGQGRNPAEEAKEDASHIAARRGEGETSGEPRRAEVGGRRTRAR